MIFGVLRPQRLERLYGLAIDVEGLVGLLHLSQEGGEHALMPAKGADVILLKGDHLHQQMLPVDGLACRGEGAGLVSRLIPQVRQDRTRFAPGQAGRP